MEQEIKLDKKWQFVISQLQLVAHATKKYTSFQFKSFNFILFMSTRRAVKIRC